MTEKKQCDYNPFPEFEESGGGEDFGDLRAEKQLKSYFDRKRSGMGKQAEDEMIDLLLKLAGPVDYVKLADMDLRKRAEIVKRIQSHFHRALPSLSEDEPDLDDDTLEEMSERPSEALSSSGALGMVLKPREYQRMALRSMGHRDLADDLEGRGMCFRPHGGPGKGLFTFSPPIGSSSLLERLAPLISRRSGLYPPLQGRVMRITIVARPKPESAAVDHPCMDQLADGYAGYRRRLLQILPRLVQFLFRDHPSMIEPICGSDDALRHAHPLADQKEGVLQSLFGMFPSMYFNRVHMPGPVSKHLDERPTTKGLEHEQLQPS
jgi:hypothetical protein